MQLTGTEIRALMRKHNITIRALKAKYGVTLKRIRHVRTHGVSGAFAQDWAWMITGEWPDAQAAT